MNGSLSDLVDGWKIKIFLFGSLFIGGCSEKQPITRHIEIITQEVETHTKVKAKVEFTDWKTGEVYLKMSDGHIAMDLSEGKYFLCSLSEDKRTTQYYWNVNDTTTRLNIYFNNFKRTYSDVSMSVWIKKPGSGDEVYGYPQMKCKGSLYFKSIQTNEITEFTLPRDTHSLLKGKYLRQSSLDAEVFFNDTVEVKQDKESFTLTYMP
jgi:hypothetical protein